MSTGSELPEAYTIPASEYLASPKFHRSHTFTPPSLSPPTPLTISYALCGSSNPSDPVLLWINGLGHHRIASVLFDSLCSSHNVRLLTLDRPSSGLSTPLPPSATQDRVRIVYESILSVLSHEKITRFSLLSHSNGIIYSLYLLQNVALSQYTCQEWFLTSPWISPSISGSIPFGLASFLPTRVTEKLGIVIEGVQGLVGPVGWSYGVAKGWVGWSSGWINSTGSVTTSTTRTNAEDTQSSRTRTTTLTNQRKRTPRDQIESFLTLESLKPIEERQFGGKYYPPGLLDKGMKLAIKEGLQGMGVEAIVCLRRGGVRWDWVEGGEKEEEEIGDGELYERGFGKLMEKAREEGWELDVRVWCAGVDGMVPKKGRDWFKELLVERIGLVKEENWTECKKAGHDEVLGLQVVVDEILSTVKQG